MPGDRFALGFYRSPDGDEPVYRWIFSDLDAPKQRAVVLALERILGEHGVGVCGTEFGRHLGRGLFEFRLRHDEEALRRGLHLTPIHTGQARTPSPVLLRVFCHAHSPRVVLLLGGYDKGNDPSPKRQQREIALAPPAPHRLPEARTRLRVVDGALA